ncbi:Ser-Thr-rich glycosyl-phosphatidyl-inositol-anchored membrane family-domain-containing protein [Jackrogersella minutella]|nr:Ser-Thr-rich glycosyl-phosphatidyl-inositol-anchored membrane family-domain-containing protein [Jackrogersella minutella]
MHSTAIFASALAFAASAVAQTAGYAAMSSPAESSKIPSGKPFTIKWAAGTYTGQATISLLGGASPSTLSPGPVLTTIDVTAGSYTWDVDCSLGKDATYGIKIASVADAATFQYSFPFVIEGPSCGASSSASGSATVSAKTASEEGGYPTLPASSSSVATSSTKEPSYPAYPTTVISTTPTYPTATSVSSAINSTTSAVPSSYVVSSPVPSYVVSTATHSGNLSYSASVPGYPTTVVTSTSALTTGGSYPTTSAPPTIPTAGASSNAAGSLALIGGLAFAALAL